MRACGACGVFCSPVSHRLRTPANATAAAAAATDAAAGVQVASCDVKGKPRQFEREMLFSKVDKVSDVAKQLSEANKVCPLYCTAVPASPVTPNVSYPVVMPALALR